jgi:hypothetical protein
MVDNHPSLSCMCGHFLPFFVGAIGCPLADDGLHTGLMGSAPTSSCHSPRTLKPLPNVVMHASFSTTVAGVPQVKCRLHLGSPDETNTFAFSLSDGTPRHVLLVKEQLEDYRTVIEYVRGQPEFDAERVVLWGSSFSGTSIDQIF